MFNLHTINTKKLVFCTKTQKELAQTYLSKFELERFKRYKSFKNQSQFLLSRAVIKKLYHNLPVSMNEITLNFETEHSCLILPQHDEKSLYVSLSHSQSELAFIVSDKTTKVGIDIEWTQKKRDIKTIANEYFSNSESEKMTTQKFYRLWTLKEALAKATGRDLAGLLRKNVDGLLKKEALYSNTKLYKDYCLSYVVGNEFKQTSIIHYSQCLSQSTNGDDIDINIEV